LTDQQLHLLNALAQGFTLKAHRDIDGHKDYRLHSPDGAEISIKRELAESLVERGWLGSNQKFPAATLWLTPAGRAQIIDRMPPT
jgi:hypothetical protein